MATNTILLGLAFWRKPRKCFRDEDDIFIEYAPSGQSLSTSKAQNKLIKILLKEKYIVFTMTEVYGEKWFMISTRASQNHEPVQFLEEVLNWNIELRSAA